MGNMEGTEALSAEVCRIVESPCTPDLKVCRATGKTACMNPLRLPLAITLWKTYHYRSQSLTSAHRDYMTFCEM